MLDKDKIAEDRQIKIRILMLGLLGFLLIIKSDRYFPLPENLPEPIFQLILIPYTLVFFICVFLFLKPQILENKLSVLNEISTIRLTAAIALVFEFIVFILLNVENRWYASFGYNLNIPITIALFIAIGATFTYLFIRDRSPKILFYTALAAYTGTYLISIASFPLNPQRSDMLPLLVSGGRSFLNGITPYGYYDIPHHLIFTYLPGMWFAYLPAVILHADPRIINLICVVLSALIIVYLTKNGRNFAFLLVSIFLLVPYLQYRHEIYLGVFFLLLSIIYVFYTRNRWFVGSAVFGYALATYQFAWIIFPFAIVSIFRKTGLRKAVVSLVIAIGIALIMILPFWLLTPDAFIGGVIGHWFYVDILAVNLSYIVSILVPWDLIIVVQCIVIVFLLLLAFENYESGRYLGMDGRSPSVIYCLESGNRDIFLFNCADPARNAWNNH